MQLNGSFEHEKLTDDFIADFLENKSS